MTQSTRQQIVISGVGGQGVLFVTRLLAEAAIGCGLPVLTSETHGMAQRGGTVISHFKVGEFYSPLIRSGQADGLIALKSENLATHAVFLKPGGWAVVNAADGEKFDIGGTVFGDRRRCDRQKDRQLQIPKPDCSRLCLGGCRENEKAAGPAVLHAGRHRKSNRIRFWKKGETGACFYGCD